jgi:hypothetical protein
VKIIKSFIKTAMAFAAVSVMVASALAAYGFFNGGSYTQAQEPLFVQDDFSAEVYPFINAEENMEAEIHENNGELSENDIGNEPEEELMAEEPTKELPEEEIPTELPKEELLEDELSAEEQEATPSERASDLIIHPSISLVSGSRFIQIHEPIDNGLHWELQRLLAELGTDYDSDEYRNARLALHEQQQQNTSVIELTHDEFNIWVGKRLEWLQSEGVSADEITQFQNRYMELLYDAMGVSEAAKEHKAETIQRLQQLPEDELFYFTPINDYITRDERMALFEAGLTGADYESIMEKLNALRSE